MSPQKVQTEYFSSESDNSFRTDPHMTFLYMLTGSVATTFTTNRHHYGDNIPDRTSVPPHEMKCFSVGWVHTVRNQLSSGDDSRNTHTFRNWSLIFAEISFSSWHLQKLHTEMRRSSVVQQHLTMVKWRTLSSCCKNHRAERPEQRP